MPPKSNATKNEVNTFLIEFKTLLSQKGIVFEPRTYNGITTIGIDIPQAEQELYSLTFHNYVEVRHQITMETELLFGNLVR